MSAIRVGSLRLCWIEAFLKVVDTENISEAAKILKISQPTASRYIQHLEKWLGKKLIEPGKINDPEDARVSVGITEDGQKFYGFAKRRVKALIQCRTDGKKSQELLDGMQGMIDKMNADLNGKTPTDAAMLIRENLDVMTKAIPALDQTLSYEILDPFHANVRSFFSKYEQDVAKEKQRKKERHKTGRIDPRTIKIPPQISKKTR